MIEREKTIKNPFYFIPYMNKNNINSYVKIVSPNKFITILLEEKKNKNKEKMSNSLFYNRRNINKSKIIRKSSTNNIFPPLSNNNKKYSVDSINNRNTNENQNKGNSYNDINNNKEKANSFRISKLNKQSKQKTIFNIKKNFKIFKKDDSLTSNNFFSPINGNNILNSIKNKINASSTNHSKFRFNEIIKIKKINKKNAINKISYSCDKNDINNLKYIKMEKEKLENNEKIKEIRQRLKKYRYLTERKKTKYKYCIYPGNNSKLIDQIMKYRNKVWEKVSLSHDKFCDFVWSPLTCSIDFKSSQIFRQCVNHIQFNEEIANKMRLYGNLLRHCEKKGIDVYKIFPFTICLTLSHHSFDEQLDNFKSLFKDINKYTPKSDICFGNLFNALLNKKIGTYQTINIPKTFNSGKNLWIIKPVNLNRGRCIKVLNNLDLILKEMKSIQMSRKILLTEGNFNEYNNINKYQNSYADTIMKTNSNYNNDKYYHNGIRCDSIMIQKYLEKPLLYQGRKFDIRIWVMFLTNRENEIYIFKEGHLKASSIKYNPDSNDLFVHLTNYSVQKHNINFSKIEIGNEIPFYEFQNELDRKKTGKNFRKDIYPKIVRIIRLTGGAALGKMNFMNIKNCFEIFGYDFILDENYRPYLLEINSNPGLEISSPLINQLLPRMIDDAFKLTIDEEFSLSSEFINKESQFPVDNYMNNENMWEKFSIL